MTYLSPESLAKADAAAAAVKTKMGRPYNEMPTRVVLAALAKHGGLYTFLDPQMTAMRMGAIAAVKSANAEENDANQNDANQNKTAMMKKMLTVDAAAELRAMAQNFFYKLIEKDGYRISSELMAYISEPGADNGVAFSKDADASPTIPAAFTFVGQFIDHDLTLNGINLTDNEQGQVVQDRASPLIDLDSVYGLLLKDVFPKKPDPQTGADEFDIDSFPDKFANFKRIFDKFFDAAGKFRLFPIEKEGNTVGYDLCREEDDAGNLQAIIFDPRNDENQLILQIHILIERFHNALIDGGKIAAGDLDLSRPLDLIKFVEKTREEVVRTWQNFVLTEYMPAIIREEILTEVVVEINKPAADATSPETQYGNLKHKPYKNLVTGKNVVRMPHEFAIGFRFGHSQLRPSYVLNEDTTENPAMLFTDARQKTPNDLRGSRRLAPEHVIKWNIFYPPPPPPGEEPDENRRSLKIDHKVTERVFNLPESAIPDDIKYIGNLAHRNLIRSTQIGIVAGEELSAFYGYDADILSIKDILDYSADNGGSDDSTNEAVVRLFTALLPSEPLPADEAEKRKIFKTPLWYYIIKEGEIHSGGSQLGKAGSRLIAEVLAGALYYGNDYPFKNDWTSVLHASAVTPEPDFGNVTITDSITLREIIEFVESDTTAPPACPQA